MVPKYRQQFNSEYSSQKYHEVLDKLREKSGIEPQFRVSESPIFLTQEFKQKLENACESIVSQINALPKSELDKAIPSQYQIPGSTENPHFLTIDFGICKNKNGEIEPQLIELQAFPTLYGFQRELQNTLCEVYPLLKDLRTEISDENYYQKLRDLIVGTENPENVILMEIYPEKQKTNIDFKITEKKLGIKTVCLTEIQKEGNQLFYNLNGKKTQIKRIYNRVIFDELEKIPDFKMPFDITKNLDVEWITHPDWFFKISKFILPKLQHEFVPKSFFVNDFPEGENLENFVLKPLFSFAGSGVNLHPTMEEISKIEEKDNYILQRKVDYAPIFEDINGEFSKAEIRLLYIWPENEENPLLMEFLVRMTKAEMVNVDFNKKNAIWIGGSTAFFA